MSYKELSRLNVNRDLKKNRYAFTLLKILIENSKLGSVLYVDDFERLLSLMKITGVEDESEEDIYSSSWLYGDDKNSPDIIVANKILDKISELRNINGLKIVITLKTPEKFEEIKRIFNEKNSELDSVLIKPLILNNFDEGDLFFFYKENMRVYFEKLDFLEILDENPDTLYPLNEKILKRIYNLAEANPREIIKHLIRIFNAISYIDENLEVIIDEYYS